MKIFYGTSETLWIDCSELFVNLSTNKQTLKIPAGDNERNWLFGDPCFGKIKRVLVIDDFQNTFDLPLGSGGRLVRQQRTGQWKFSLDEMPVKIRSPSAPVKVQRNYQHYLSCDGVDVTLDRYDSYRFYVVYFVNCLVNLNYFQWIETQLGMIKSFSALEIHIVAVCSKAQEQLLRERIDSLLPPTGELKVFLECFEENHFEYRGCLRVWLLGQQYRQPNDIILYFHSKGITHHRCFKDEHYNVLLKDSQKITEIFDLFPTIDKIGIWCGGWGWIWINFFFVRGSYVCQVERPIQTTRRHYYEDWLGRKVRPGDTLFPEKERDQYIPTLEHCYSFHTSEADAQLFGNIGSYFDPSSPHGQRHKKIYYHATTTEESIAREVVLPEVNSIDFNFNQPIEKSIPREVGLPEVGLNPSSINVFIHVCTLSCWKQVLSRQLEKIHASGLYDSCDTIQLGVLGDGNLDEFICKYPKLTVLFQSSAIAQYERPTLMALHQRSFHLAPLSCLFYLHTKGVTRPNNTCVSDWSELLEYFLLERWRDCVSACRGGVFDMCGINYATNPAPHFSGNFWCASAAYIASLSPEIGPSYLAPEMWIGSGNGRHQSFHQSVGINHYDQPYPRHLYALHQ
jgi:hypothetical protein